MKTVRDKSGRLLGQVVLVTGASSGLGEQIAYEAARQQAIVILCARRKEKLITIARKCQQLSGQPAFYYELDLIDPQQVDQMLADIRNKISNIDILVNCAGFGLFRDFLAFDLTVAREMFEVNVLGLMHLTQKVALEMAPFGSGQIVMIASQAGKIATMKSSVYSATKAAVISFSNALRLELKPLGITVMTVNPGPIKTAFFDRADETGNYLNTIDKVAIEPDKLAKKIVRSFKTKRREINTPIAMEVANKAYILFPKIGDFLTGNVFNTK
ncbi:SDR family NAD(P)-dependent oxidoreductase [Vagococcus intermedius]|uniref:SDR family oxidoreductase n=1 Tax=Vagococcus intermedius TaxID=2991418 RepID=A0AAF0CTI2_9ENTE|nr:SDR family oxidoreductase [Vagococcus intermedius]WEG72648.1 SDR family oxidoreductase [Vagococcus intermedius]WEG74733.1 SDR family oxidoreductase [Vagococcus intermedius]